MTLRARLSRLVRGPQVRPVILMYHRIAAPKVDPWGLSVSPDNFRSQLRMLKSRRTPMTMDGLARACREGRLPDDAIALTFDDGYRDNLAAAKPLLEAEGVPATILVTTGWVGSKELLWWDELTRLILLRAEPFSGSLTIAGEGLPFAVGPADDWEPRRTWRSWDPPRSEREKLYVMLWTRLQRLGENERQGHVRELAAQLGASPAAPADDDDRVMTRAELGRLASPMVGVGVHAVTHQPLTSMPPAQRRAEVMESRTVLEEVTGQPMTGFAYPHGDLDEETRAIVGELGFEWAVTTESRAVRPGADHLLALPRIMAPDLRGPQLLDHIAEQSR